MPTRYLKSGIRDSELIDNLSPLAETFYYRLLVTVDDFGRFDARPAMIKAQCFPIKESVTVKNCGDMLKELADSGLIDIYQVEGKSVLQVCKWDNVPRAKESKYPDKPTNAITLHTNACKIYADVPLTVTVTETKTDIEPNGSVATTSKIPNCPTTSIVDLYHKTLPELPLVRLMPDSRAKAISKFWKWVFTSEKTDGTHRATTADEALNWVQEYFDRARENDFLMGRGGKSAGHENWQCDIDFLMTEKGMKHVIEKTKEVA